MRTRKLWSLAAVLAVVASGAIAVSAASGSTTPLWFIGGSELSGTETLGGAAEPSTMSAAGVTTQCQHAYYVASIFNSSGLGKGEVTALPFYECSANDGCTVASVEAKGLPWQMHTVYEESKPYLVIEGVKLEVTYEGSSCPLKGTSEVTGSVGGQVYNAAQETVFDSASASATGASLKDGTTSVAYEGTYTEEAVGPEHHGEIVEAR
jgi:hypothetical protein